MTKRKDEHDEKVRYRKVQTTFTSNSMANFIPMCRHTPYNCICICNFMHFLIDNFIFNTIINHKQNPTTSSLDTVGFLYIIRQYLLNFQYFFLLMQQLLPYHYFLMLFRHQALLLYYF